MNPLVAFSHSQGAVWHAVIINNPAIVYNNFFIIIFFKFNKP